MRLLVDKKNGEYSTVQEAINAVPYNEESEIVIGEGVFREKLFCEKKNIVLTGAGTNKTVIDFDDYANEIMEDGSKRGTFRSYTAFFGGENVTVRNMTIKNSAGDGRVVGQALAVYADADRCLFENVKLLGFQDTLFCAPLPVAERQVQGFMGPRMLTERRLTRQYYKNCHITGDVDFIFGGADAVFDDCTIICNDRMHASAVVSAGVSEKDPRLDKDQIEITKRLINGYITATCGLKENMGFVFRNCIVLGAEGCEKGSVFLGRPWREEAKTVFLNCKMDESIAPERFSGWGGINKDEPDTFYGEYASTYVGSDDMVDLSQKNSWIRDIDADKAKEISKRADAVVKLVLDCCDSK